MYAFFSRGAEPRQIRMHALLPRGPKPVVGSRCMHFLHGDLNPRRIRMHAFLPRGPKPVVGSRCLLFLHGDPSSNPLRISQKCHIQVWQRFGKGLVKVWGGFGGGCMHLHGNLSPVGARKRPVPLYGALFFVFLILHHPLNTVQM